MDIGLIFSAGKVASSIAALTGLIDSVDAKLDRLTKADLSAALISLDQASSSEKETISLLRESRLSFNRAIGLEKNFRLAVAYLGLSLCHYRLGDCKNSKNSLKEITLIYPDITAIQSTKAQLYDMYNVAIDPNPLNKLKLIAVYSQFNERLREETKTLIKIDKDINALVKVQLSVSEYINKPVKWLKQLGISEI
ncbi:hypothetical protein [Acaryochloris marina]|uniref:TPR domain protein n=1 Tax=Acaryochloris marina (strain MBIC 11017) TaxID=329726 RepID=A8ZR01_ACAM1|nr:hypothetical protein [Acaryochloris marina]ABW33437.1 hypothetical protein AM1_H0087 [Acaryochloris marina MBIC11017]